MAILQLEYAARVLPQVVEDATAKPAPDGTSEEIVSVDGWLLYKVSVKIALVVPTTTLLKCSAVDVKVAAAMPDPLNDTVCGELGAVVVMVSVPAG
jgi:hypothetical protein